MNDTGGLALKKVPRSLRLFGYLRMFVRVRFGAALAVLAAVAASDLVLHIDFPFTYLYAIAFVVLSYNAGFHLFLERKRPEQPSLAIDSETDLRANRIVALLQINLDYAALFLLLHFSGGIENPFLLFFLFHVVIAGILLDGPLAAAEAVLAAGLVLALGVFEKTGVLDHYHASAVFGSFEMAGNWMFVLGVSAIMAATIAALSVFTVVLMGQRTTQRNQLIALSLDLQAKNDRLQRLDESRRRLLAVASHDIKSPLAAVTTYLHALRDGYLGPVGPSQAEVIEKSLKRLERLRAFVGDILSLQSIRHGEMQKAMQPTDVVGLLREVVSLHEDMAKEKDISLNFDAEGALPYVEAAPEQLVQVFDNLLSNAIKYTPRKGRVRVSAESHQSRLLVEVADTGIGISDADLSHLFEDFFRSPSVKTTHEGTGLGLAVTHRIVQAHHGEIWATSELGEGTSFHVSLPVVQPLHSVLPEERDSEPLIAEVFKALQK